ncbi:hypothetical protein LG634_22090 [Streptomyces bambusae]|uniref:hypothetical protein n=1 Tax=Streptomyces bambusae TaxID=1550616 RepID=UPI001CFEF9A2|nr:hypothetical protein [Streptomyces bambusae]MCB5167507.1 hypothetical protein [Streptomyces bambusae]
MRSDVPDGHVESIYLSDVEPNPVGPLVHAADLRSRVLLHVLLADALLVGDSQSLNNKYFRSLISPAEGDGGADAPQAHGSTVLADLAPLLQEGRIRVARRAGSTLLGIRDDHAAKQVNNVPDRAYVGRLDALTAGRTVPYDVSAVGEAFRDGVLARIDAALGEAAEPVRSALAEARQWAAEQPRLLHIELRGWIASYRATAAGRHTGVVLALQSLDDWAIDAYRTALPRVLGAGVARPREAGDLPQGAHPRLLDQGALPGALLDPFLLSRLPADFVLEAVAQPARTAVVQQLARVRRGLRPDVPELGGAVEEFSRLLREAFERAFRPAGGPEWDHLQGTTRLMRFGLHEDPLSGRLGASLDVGSVAADRYGRPLSFAVTGGAGVPDPAAADRPEAAAAAAADPYDRLVSA